MSGRRFPASAAALALVSLPALAWAQDGAGYPTEVRVEYVMTCMATNGETPEMLRRCSCAIDNIAQVLPYDAYVGAETVLRMRQTSGERAGAFQSGALPDKMVEDLRRAEAEAEILCF